MLTHENYEYLLARYAEVSGAAADFEQFLMMLAPFIGNGCQPGSGSAVHFAIGEFSSDRPMQEVMSSLMLAFIRKQRSDFPSSMISTAQFFGWGNILLCSERERSGLTNCPSMNGHVLSMQNRSL